MCKKLTTSAEQNKSNSCYRVPKQMDIKTAGLHT